MVVIVYENALTDINCSDLFQSETVPFDWEEHEFEHDGTTSDTREQWKSGNKAQAKRSGFQKRYHHSASADAPSSYTHDVFLAEVGVKKGLRLCNFVNVWKQA